MRNTSASLFKYLYLTRKNRLFFIVQYRTKKANFAEDYGYHFLYGNSVII